MRDFEKLINEGKRECNHCYELSMREMVGLLKEAEKGSHEMFLSFMRCYYAGFASGQRCLKAKQRNLDAQTMHRRCTNV